MAPSGPEIHRDVTILAEPEERPGRETFLRSQQFTVFVCCFGCYSAVIPLLFRCYLTAAGFKKPEFLRPSEALPLYFSGIISGISERGHPRSKSARDVWRFAAAAKKRCIRECACFETRAASTGSLLSISMLLIALRKLPHPEVPREARPRRTHDILDRHGHEIASPRDARLGGRQSGGRNDGRSAARPVLNWQ